MLQFDLPLTFLLLPLPLLLYWLLPQYRDRGEAVRAPFFSRLVRLTGMTPSSGAVVLRKNTWQRINLMFLWLMLVTALAGPQWADDPVVREESARDLLLVVDLSGSMEAEDFASASGAKISRLDAVKEVLDEFIDRRNGDRLGLAVFGSAAFPQSPFTNDHAVVRQLLDELQPRMPGPQTMIGDAIGLAVRLFESSTAKKKLVIMLTDGNDTGSQMPVGKAAEIAAQQNIVIHTIAMGDPATVGEEALNTEVLENISSTTGGRFFVALDRRTLDEIYVELDRIEPALLETVSYRPKRSLFHYPLALAVLASLLMAIFLTGRPVSRQAWPGANRG